MERICLICNPTAKSGGAAAALQTVIGRLKASEADFTVRETKGPGHAQKLALQAVEEGYSLIVSVGGDGTMRDIASALVHTDATLGIIPCGTGNDFVKTVKVPVDPEIAADVLLSGEDRMIDVGFANGKPFFNIAGIGFDVDVLDYTEEFKPRCRKGSTAYLLGLLKALFRMKQRRATLRFESGTVETTLLLIAAGNGRFFGGGMEVTPNADPADGLLDICFIHDVDLYGILTVLPKFLKGKHLGCARYVTYRKERSVTVECDPVSRMELDGERMMGTPVEIRIDEKALKIRVPRVLPDSSY